MPTNQRKQRRQKAALKQATQSAREVSRLTAKVEAAEARAAGFEVRVVELEAELLTAKRWATKVAALEAERDASDAALDRALGTIQGLEANISKLKFEYTALEDMNAATEKALADLRAQDADAAKLRRRLQKAKAQIGELQQKLSKERRASVPA